MRWIFALLVVAALAGCTESDPSESPMVQDLDSGPGTDTNATADTAGNETVAPDGNATAESPEVEAPEEPAPENVTVPEEQVVLEQHFEGTAPAAVPGEGAIVIDNIFELPGGATRLRILYQTTYTGVISAYLIVLDGAGTERAVAGDDCAWELAPGALETYVCDITLEEALGAGSWNAQLNWQAGEVAEQFTIDVTAMGYPA